MRRSMSASAIGRFETAMLTRPENLARIGAKVVPAVLPGTQIGDQFCSRLTKAEGVVEFPVQQQAAGKCGVTTQIGSVTTSYDFYG